MPITTCNIEHPGGLTTIWNVQSVIDKVVCMHLSQKDPLNDHNTSLQVLVMRGRTSICAALHNIGRVFLCSYYTHILHIYNTGILNISAIVSTIMLSIITYTRQTQSRPMLSNRTFFNPYCSELCRKNSLP